MLLFVTLRPHTLFIDRRIRNFENLGISFRHFPLSRVEYPQLFRRIDAILWIVLRIPVMVSAIARLRREIRSLGPHDVLYVKALDCLLATLLARALSGNRSRLICEILDVHDYLLYPSPYGRPTIARAGTAMGRFADAHGVGLSIEEPCEDALPAALSSLTDESYSGIAARVREQQHLFVGESDLAEALTRIQG